ncbi:MAG: hypothetical protein DMF06_02030 [Verrucomicrobia bacterium]|nr:MAG: hypothetical protein DMF06_02030 [Verrucomicrobiota bacterium]
MDIEHSGHRYQTYRGSDVQRDGMSLELVVDGRPEAPVIEAFFSDATGACSIQTFGHTSIPLEILREFMDEAKRSLPPVSQTS